ncbi:S24 family peptidase [Aedoeadaptatus coxii]|uniref:LexA family protein n=1 Tax=Aedoeadaptatus coxii TaxID=755172 RepID=UPI002AD55E51|nr:S24 family peptidase [Peptoniphilus coxii]
MSPIAIMGWGEELKPVDLSSSVKIPVVGKIPAGVPVEAIEDIVDYIDIPEDWTKGNAEFIGLEVKGDSMYPVMLDGDRVVIRVQPTAETGDICACYVNGYDATLKRIALTSNSITLKPENPSYPPETYTHPGEVTIVGKVVEIRRKV